MCVNLTVLHKFYTTAGRDKSLVDLVDVTLACEDANSKLVDVDQEMCKNLSYGLIEVNLVSRTQPSDPLHLCQCLN